MSTILTEFQKKYHPCYYCVLRICCSITCENFNKYHNVIYKCIVKHFPRHKGSQIHIFQFYISKFFYLELNDHEAKKRILLPNTFENLKMTSKKETIKRIIKAVVKEKDGL